MFFLGLQHKLEKLKLNFLKKNSTSPLLDLWQALPKNYSHPWQSYDYLCVDLEFSELDSQKGDLLSIGWATISLGKLLAGTAQHYLVKNRRSVGQSAGIHYIRDSEAAQGIAVNQALQFFLQACRGKILIFHHASLDLSYLNKICRALYGSPLCLPYCDTFELEKAKLMRSRELIPHGGLRLQACRHRYHLPPYPPHHATIDAIACGELFMAQVASKGDNVSLQRLL